MNAPQQNLITTAGKLCAQLLVMKGAIDQIDVLYSGSPNWDDLITQPEIDEVASFLQANLTVSNVADAVYILKLIRDNVNSNLPAMVMLANLG